MKLYAISGTCSLAPHILLQYSGEPFELCLLDRDAGEQKSPQYKAINPRGKVPALEVDGDVILENVAIQYYLASRFPALNLAPAGLTARTRWLTFLTWCSNSVHPSFRRFRRPELHSPEPSAWPGVSEVGKQEFLAALREIDERLTEREWLFGDAFSTADAYVHVFHLWALMAAFSIDDLSNLQRHGRTLMAMPAVQRAFDREKISRSVFGED